MKAAGNRLITKRSRRHTTRLRWGAVNVRTMQTKIHNVGGELCFEGAEPTKPYETCDLLAAHDISLCAMSEVRWKGQGTLSAGEYLYIFSGLPEEAPVSLYGVAIALNPAMQKAWRAAGSQVSYCNERLLKIKLRLDDRIFHVISVYAPTFRASETEKESFYAQLAKLTSECKSSEELVIMGDFNARVGTRGKETSTVEEATMGDVTADLVLGDFGMEELNDNGRLLLDFCRSQRGKSLRVMDTLFQHSTYGTWQHNRTKQWHHIDHIITSAKTAALCMDVKVMAGLDFDSDHRMLRLDLRIVKRCKQWWGRKREERPESHMRIPALDVARLKEPEVVAELNEKFADIIGDGLTDAYELWSHGLRRCAEATVGMAVSVKRPQWQVDNSTELAQLSKIKREAYAHKDESPEALQNYKAVCKANKKKVSAIINRWWANAADDIQQAVNRKDPNHQYQGYRQLRKVFNDGRRPPAKVKDKKGKLLGSRPDRVARWQEHFRELLNVDTSVDDSLVEELESVPLDLGLAEVPLFAETLAAVHSLKRGKATGPDGIPAEVLSVLSHSAIRSLHEHICQIWMGCGDIPPEWHDADLIPLPKTGDLSLCSKWRGILLTSVPGKVFSKILNGRLVRHFESHDVLPETQCGFRAGRGTADMIFTLRMAIELARAKHIPLYVLFVDLMKAYDSVSRTGLWAVLKRKGVPDHMIALIRRFYEGKVVRVAVEGTLSEPFELCTGLGQGCCLAPLLFNVFLSAVMEGWEARVPDKLRFQYRLDGILRRHMDEKSLNKYTTWESLQLHELGYADDAAFVTDTYDKLVKLACELQEHYLSWGLTMSVEKTELLLTEGIDPSSITVQETGGFSKLHFCQNFKYLGSKVEKRQGCVQEITYRLDKARKAFWSLARHVWDVKQLSLAVKLQVYRACVLSVLLYGAESWTTTFLCRRKLETFHMKCLRKISQVTILDQEQKHLNNDALRAFLGVPSIRCLVTQARLRWLGHLARMPAERLPKQMLFAFLPGDVGQPTKPGRRTGKWLSFDLVNDLEAAGVPKAEWMHFARKNHGSDWRKIVYQAAPWFLPQAPTPNCPPPKRDASTTKTLRPHRPKKPFWQLVDNIHVELAHSTPQSGFLRAEMAKGGENALREQLIQWFDAHVPGGWWLVDAQTMLYELMEDEEWLSYAQHDIDLGLFLGVIRTIQHMKANAPPPPPPEPPQQTRPLRTRIKSKQPRPESYATSACAAPAAPPRDALALLIETPTVGMRTPKSRQEVSTIIHAEGEFQCAICDRKFPTKLGLMSHIQATHTEGTFREAGFQCILCPRLFARQNKLTQHYNRDRVHNSTALVCPHCRSVFPGEPMLRLHMAEAHEIPADIFPTECPLCVARGDRAPVHISNPLTFKRHRTAEHLRDHPVQVYRE